MKKLKIKDIKISYLGEGKFNILLHDDRQNLIFKQTCLSKKSKELCVLFLKENFNLK